MSTDVVDVVVEIFSCPNLSSTCKEFLNVQKQESVFPREGCEMHTYFSPSFTFRSGVSPALPIKKILNLESGRLETSACADGSFWCVAAASPTSQAKLYSFDFGQNAFQVATDFPSYLFDDSSRRLAAVDYRQVYFIADENGTPKVHQFTFDDGITSLPDLPQGDTPVCLSAASDGNLWAVGSSGTPYWFDETKAWQARPCSVGAMTLISAGSGSFVLGLAGGQPVTYTAAGWSSFEAIPKGVTWLAACADGSFWLRQGPQLTVGLPEGASKTFVLSYPEMIRFTAASRSVCYFVGGQFSYEQAQVSLLAASWGVLDQPVTPWPAMNAGQQRGYQAITEHLGLIDHQGVRGQYTVDSNDFSRWHNEVANMKCPDRVSADDWHTIQQQILQELADVQQVKDLFTDLVIQAVAVASSQSDYFNKVKETMEYKDWSTAEKNSIVGVIFDAIIGGLLSEGLYAIPGALGSAARLGVEVIRSVAASVAEKHGQSNLNEAVKMEVSKIDDMLGGMVESAPTTTWQIFAGLVGDWGRLNLATQAANKSIWSSSNSQDSSPLKEIGRGAEISYYQMLMPVRYEIMLVETFFSIHNPPDAVVYPPHAPAFALLYCSKPSGSGPLPDTRYWWFICTERGQAASPYTTGPFPNPNLTTATFDLGVSPSDFFRGQSGWNWHLVVQSGVSLPPQNATWADYSKSTEPVR